MDPANESRWAGKALTCHACAATDRERHKFHKDPDALTDGVFVVPVERPDR
jgi:hypothetical protein